uniref:Uncharacterized protein n=1 Tax=Rhizophora mucronata TaxID=61149 RepID=A0A2P2P3W8_RHIMU
MMGASQLTPKLVSSYSEHALN